MALLVNILFALASIVVIAISARYAILAICRYAETTGISKYLVGFLVVSIGTSLPDISTAIVGSITKQGSLILGSLIGANILDVTLILGVTAILAKKIKIEGQRMGEGTLTVLFMVLLPLILGLDGTFSRFDGFILLGTFAGYAFYLIKKEKKLGKIKKQIPFRKIWVDMVVFLISMIALLLSARWLLISALHIALEFNIPIFTMGLFLVAIGTTVPELAISIKSALSGVSSITFGDILGAVIANSTLVLGLAALISPIVIETSAFIGAALFMVTGVFIGVLFLNKKEITWKEGIGLILVYLTFVVTQNLR